MNPTDDRMYSQDPTNGHRTAENLRIVVGHHGATSQLAINRMMGLERFAFAHSLKDV